MKKKKQKWGKSLLAEGFVIFGTGKDVPIRVLVSFPYNWHLTHDGSHTKKHWEKRRRVKP